jgi:hypothetical protein
LWNSGELDYWETIRILSMEFDTVKINTHRVISSYCSILCFNRSVLHNYC